MNMDILVAELGIKTHLNNNEHFQLFCIAMNNAFLETVMVGVEVACRN